MVARLGFGVSIETPTNSSADKIVIGTTGINPKTAVPPAVRASTSTPPTAQATFGGPASGGGTCPWKIATAITPAPLNTVAPTAPPFSLPRQNSAATTR